MTALDWMVVLIMAASVLLSLMRGLVVELFSLAAWVVAFVGAKWGASVVAPLLPIEVQVEGMRYFVGFIAVFLVMMLAAMILGHLVKGAVGKLGLGAADKLIGGLFGAMRGLVILTGLTLAAGLTALPQTGFWKNTVSSKFLETLAMAAEPLLPSSLVKHIHFSR